MGEEVQIVNVAKRLAQLRGLRVPEDIAITFTGLRPGERLNERLVGESERSVATPHPKIHAIVGVDSIAPAEWDVRLADLTNGNYRDANVLRRRLLELARDGCQPALALR
jgi:O-antigen biosynthesis protein WbqV